MAERARIARYFAPLATDPDSFSLRDDAALLNPPAGASLVVTTDSVIEGIHVLADATPQQFAQKLVRRNLSDLAAMGAAPWRYSLNLHTPHGLPDDWIAAFADTLAAEQARYGMQLIGGDSTSARDARLHTTMTCFGLLRGAPLRRSGARASDDVYVSGTIGDAALGLMLLQSKFSNSPPAGESNRACDSVWGNMSTAIVPPPHAQGNLAPPQGRGEEPLIARYHLPEPRLALGGALVGIATAALDISDGMGSDLAQLCAASHVGAVLQQSAIPLSLHAQQILQQTPEHWERILHGGDDYELLFTAPPSARTAITALAQQLQLPLTRIGEIVAGESLQLVDIHGVPCPLPLGGFEHR